MHKYRKTCKFSAEISRSQAATVPSLDHTKIWWFYCDVKAVLISILFYIFCIVSVTAGIPSSVSAHIFERLLPKSLFWRLFCGRITFASENPLKKIRKRLSPSEKFANRYVRSSSLMYKTISRAPRMWASPILSGLRSLNETVEVPRPPDLVVTMISPLSSLAGPTRQTILLADIHSAVSRQLWPQIERPEEEEKRKVTGVSEIDTGRQQKQTECSNETQTHRI